VSGSRKTGAADEWRAALRREAANWLAERFPGAFHRLAPGQLPTIELLLTGQYYAWEPIAREPISQETIAQRPRTPEWTGILDLLGFGYWQCLTVPALRLSERHARARKSDQHTLVLSAPENDLITAAPSDSKNLPAIISGLDWPVSGLLVRWSLTALLRELEEQPPAIQDSAESASRKRSVGALDEAQRQLLHAGLDIQIVVNDIARFTENTRWAYELLDFSRVPAPGRALAGEPTVTLAQLLRRGQAEDGPRISRMERDLREVLVTNANLAAARANLRPQWTAVSIAVVAAAAAIAAVVIALLPYLKGPAPIQHPNTRQTVMPSTPTSSAKPTPP
jgi:hypothetical protein